MFESICIRLKNEAGNQSLEKMIDFGFLAEAMLFYQNVHLIVDQTFLKLVVKKFAPDVLLNFLESGFLKISYLENNTAISTNNSGTDLERHKPILYSIPDYAWEKYSRELFAKAIGLTPKGARRYSIQASRYIKPIVIDNSVESEALEDFSNGKYVKNAVVSILKHYIPEYNLPNPFMFEIENDNGFWVVNTNIDFEKANKHYHKYISPKHSSLSVSYLLSNLMSARGELYFSSHFSSEIATDVISNKILNFKFNDLISSRNKNDKYINTFQEFVFDEGRAMREVFNKGERNFRELFNLLLEANKFKHWLKDQPPNKELVKEYFREVSKNSWIDKLPPKVVRWSLFSLAGLGIDALGAGGIGKVLGLALSAGDQFLLEKILKGWKPNQFIDTSLKDFVSAKADNQPKQ